MKSDERNNKKKNLTPHIIALVFSALVLVLSVSSMFAWFVMIAEPEATGMQLILSADKFDVLVDRSEKTIESYDTKDSSGNDLYEGITEFKDILSGNGYELSGENGVTKETRMVGLELENEFVFEGQYYLMPGSYGTLSFYIKPRVFEDFSASVSLEFGGYVKGIDNNGEFDGTITDIKDVVFDEDQYILEGQKTKKEVILDLLKGHILFFTDRTLTETPNPKDPLKPIVNLSYGNLVTDELYFVVSSNRLYVLTDPLDEIDANTAYYPLINDGTKSGYFKVTLYWSWPIIYEEMIDYSDGSVREKYPSSLGDYILTYPDYFFLNENVLTNEEKENSYNDGDQAIGDNLDYIVVYLKLE